MPSSRRAPSPDERVRDAERTRAALVAAAEVEFADKGLAGARVEAIAARAGVNKQLISYYYGGKQGLYDALLERWYMQEREFDGPDVSLVDLVLRYLEASQGRPHLQRLFLRESMDQDPDELEHEPDDADVRRLRERQEAGEIAPDLDPAFVLLFLEAMVVARDVFPGDVKRLTGLDPSSEECYAKLREQLAAVVRRLAEPQPPSVDP